MFSLTYAIVFGLCAVASAQVEYNVSIYDYSPKPRDNNTILYTRFYQGFTANNSYQFKEFTAGFHNYSDYPTLVVHQPAGVNELAGYYFPKGMLSIFSYGMNTTFYDKYKAIRDYFLAGNRIAFTPTAASNGYNHFLQYYLKNFTYGDSVPTEFAVAFVSIPVSPLNISSNFQEIERYGYNGTVIKSVDKSPPTTQRP